MSDSHKLGEPREALSPLKQAFLALDQAETRIRELERAASEPIAIVGMGCRIPGAENGPEDFWRLIKEVRCTVDDRVSERMAASGYVGELPVAARRAALLERVDLFDPRHFGISPREAAGMDPQQRLLLEVAWEALENAGIDSNSLYQSPTGVFVGIAAHDYMQLQIRRADASGAIDDPHFASGSAASVAAGRISYVLGLNGPAMSVDTACSSSLVAVHLACESLRRNECTAALAAGVNLILSAEASFAFTQSGMLSPRGFCSAFDSSADGFVRGEGCGVVVLKRLRDAESNGDRVLGVILGSAVNQDGASSGLTVPNGLAQQALVREAHRRSGIEPSQVGYVEAHGTGTTLGDPIEAEALGAVFAGRREKLAIGSVKTNLGHLESAAGIAGLIKLVLSLEHGRIPAQLHWTGPSEHVRWADLPLEVVTEARAWEPIGGRRIGGVSSFGLSGTNAHVVVEGYKRAEPTEGSDEGPEALVLSARTEAALRELAEKYAGYLETETEWGWREICATAGVGRAAFAERLAVVAASRREAAAKLRGWLEGQNNDVHRGHVGAGHRGGTALSADASPATVAAQFVAGNGTDWRRRGAGLRRAALPTYAFQRERYWVEAGPRQGRGMLGRRLEQVAGTRGVFETLLTSAGWIGEHSVEGHAVLPATGHVELMLEAGTEIVDGGCRLEELVLEDVLLEARLTVDGQRKVQTVVEPPSGGRSRVRVYAAAGDDWERVSEGWLSRIVATDAESQPQADVAAIQARLHEMPAGEPFYRAMADRGVSFGERFRGVRRLWAGDGEALGEIAVTEAAGEDWQTAPWWLDACLQTAGAAAGDQLYLPLGIDRVRFHAPPSQTGPSKAAPSQTAWSHLQSRQSNENTIAADLDIFSTYGDSIAKLNGIRFRKIERTETDIESWLYKIEWRESLLPKNRAAKKVLVIGTGELANDLAKHLTKKGILSRYIQAEQIPDEEVTGFDTVIWAADGLEEEAPEFSLRAGGLAEKSIRSLLATVQWLARRKTQARLYVVTAGTCAVIPNDSTFRLDEAPLRGMATAIATEFPELRCTRIDTDGSESALLSIVEEVLSDADELQVAWRTRTRYAARLERWPVSAQLFKQKLPVKLMTSGGIDGLAWVPAEQRDLRVDEVEIEVRAATLNFHDVLQVLGVIPDEGTPGADCAGVVLQTGKDVTDLSPGDEVVAIAGACFASRVLAARSLVVRKPTKFTFSESTGQTIAYLTAAYCLEEIAQLRAGETVLVHAAAGGVGLAALHVCRRMGARVIATAGSEKKRQYLRGLGIEQVYDSRSFEFASQIGGGVDVVLNSLAGEAVDAGLALLNRNGRFVEMGRTDLREAAKMASDWPDVKYIPVDLTPLISGTSPWICERIKRLFAELGAGELPLLPVATFRAESVKDAFRFMARAAHVGRVVVEMRRDFSGAHVVTGGMRGMGLRVAEWLGENGATSLVLIGRNEPDSAAQQRIEAMRSRGIVVQIVRGDIADSETAARAVQSAGPRLTGIWHAAGILENLAAADQTWDSIRRVMRPKADGAWNLHAASLGVKLNYFVLFSSWASIGGAHGQINYCGANSFLDGLAQFRHSKGLPALSVNWGAWQRTGMTADATVQRLLARAGMEVMSPNDALDALDRALESDNPQAAIAAIHWPRYLNRSRGLHDDPFYSEFSQRQPGADTGADPRSADAAAGVGVAALLSSPRENGHKPANFTTEAALFRTVGDIVRRTLELHAGEEIDPEIPLGDLGMDSLLAVELKNALAASLHRQLPPTLLFDFPTLRSLVKYLEPRPESGAVQSRQVEQGSAVIPIEEIGEQTDPLDLLNALEQMTDEEVESRLERSSHG